MAYQNIMRRYKALKAPFRRQVSFAGAARVFRVLGKKSTRAKETVLQRLGRIQNPFNRQNSSEVPNMFKRQYTVHNDHNVTTMFDEIEEIEDDENHLSLPSNLKTQKSCAF